MINTKNITLKCPFCGKETISAIHISPVLQAGTSHAAGQTKTKYYYTKEKTEIASGCSNCGKSQKEVERALKDNNSDVEKEKRIFERLKQQGIIKDEMTTKF